MIPITDRLAIDEDEVVERFVRASGPGGQHVNKTSTAVELRFDVRRSRNLPEDVKLRLEALAGSRLTQDGVIVIFAQTHSAQHRNREEAMGRLMALIRQAAVRRKPRRPTKPTYGSQLKRLQGKAIRSGLKSGRGKPIHHD